MFLTRATAAAIVEAVDRDPMCRSNVNSFLRKVLPDSIGRTGSVRNFALALAMRDPSEEKYERWVCTGIAKLTSQAINRALDGGGTIPGVRQSECVDRFHPICHTATRITTRSGSDYVFDWHATLDTRNPMIYRLHDWMACRGGVTFEKFQGL